ncbi:uncharacterized protein LOC108222523 isoform X2 [Daucus carota subsp. sativus]|uniref:uncharacterized protein LOC108222523 isoform X2 n=1 Tax=Daucus carota subsp. sativus TaxID=79200 RepID=UPI0030828E5B
MALNTVGDAVGLDYWLQWQVLVCALIIIIPLGISLKITIRSSGNGHQQLKSCDLWLPCWKNLHPKWLLLYRVIAFCSMAFLLYQTVASFGLFVFYFYTQWTFTLVLLYFAIGIIVSSRGCSMYSKKPSTQVADGDTLSKKDHHEKANNFTTNVKAIETKSLSGQEAGALEILMHSIYHACAGAVVLTDLVFWFILVPLMSGKDFKLTVLIGLMHSVNVVFLLLDSAFNNHPFPWSRFTYFVLWTGAYIIFQWTIHACGVTWWPYPFLELNTPWAPAWYFGMALFHVPCYGLYALLVKAKDFVFSRIFPHAFLRVTMEKKQP